MESDSGTVARAFELAKSGTVKNVTEIARRLKAEGLTNVEAHLAVRTIKAQHMALIRGQQADVVEPA